MQKATLMYCSQGAPDYGTLRRGVAVARQLQRDFDVTMLIDDSQRSLLPPPNGLHYVTLPDLAAEDSPRDRQDRSLELLLHQLMRTFETIRPRVLAIDSFPFFRHDLHREFLPLLTHARGSNFGELLVTSITDCTMSRCGTESESRSDTTADILERFFDLAIVRSDPLFAREEEFLQPRNAIHTPLFHVGFVAINSSDLHQVGGSRSGILVSAGQGDTGAPLFRVAIEAHEMISQIWSEPMTIVAGQDLPEKEWSQMCARAEQLPSLTLKRTSPDLGMEMAAAKWSLCQCDYDSAVNSMRAQTPSLFVPNGINRHGRQAERARRLVYWGAGRLLLPRLLNAASLVNEIHQLSKFEARRLPFNLKGSQNAARLITQIALYNNYNPVGTGPSLNSRLH